ncbi:MAG: phosphoribosylamine--glycine ligase, partial [Anaerolineae bacterium]|nr:phosphoribosylamine--glycine ligase [Anaerolineae bacterium]
MKVLVVGSGGREHALSWALARSPHVDTLYIAPGNGGTGDLGRNVAIAADDVAGITRFAREEEIDLAVIGPEKPLALGLTDALQTAGIRAFGPSAQAACIESSKAYSKRFMRAQGIPSADFAVFDDYTQARAYIDQQGAPIVVKASGLAAGKGAIVCQNKEEAYDALDLIMRQHKFGSAGDLVVIEECLQGQEVSVLAFTDGESVVPMVLSQDHKPAYDGDRGPNTGGMGCYAPAPLLSDEMLAEVERTVLQ